MSLLTRDGKVNGHTMQGNEGYHTPVSYAMDAPISDLKTEFLTGALEKMFPNKEFDVVGAYWDYAESTNPETCDNANGHYRVNVSGVDYVVCVNNFSDQDGWNLGHQVYDLFKQEGINANSNVQIPFRGEWSVEHNDLHVHLEEYHGDAVWLKDKKLNQDNIAAKLGKLIGQVYNAAQKAPEELRSDLEGYTDATLFQDVRTGVQFLNKPDAIKAIGDALSGTNDGDRLYRSLTERVKDITKIITNGERVMQHGNMIEKMIAVNGDGNLSLKGVDAAPNSFMPMMTDNATYDAGTAVYRMFLNPAMIDATPEDVDAKTIEALNNFVDAYNETTGLNLTPTEALTAAYQANTLLAPYEVGHYLTGKKLSAAQSDEFKAHVTNVMAPVHDRLQQVERLTKLIQASEHSTLPKNSLKSAPNPK